MPYLGYRSITDHMNTCLVIAVILCKTSSSFVALTGGCSPKNAAKGPLKFLILVAQILVA